MVGRLMTDESQCLFSFLLKVPATNWTAWQVAAHANRTYNQHVTKYFMLDKPLYTMANQIYCTELNRVQD